VNFVKCHLWWSIPCETRGVTAYPLARIQIPEPGFIEPTLYVRHSGGEIRNDGLALGRDDRATFDTAFGVFASGRWSRLTAINDIGVTMKISGKSRVDLIAFGNGTDTVIATSDECSTLTCSDIRTLAAESFYVAVTALEDGVVIHSGEWTTTAEPVRDVRLGVSITTFNRQDYVLKTVDRLVELESSVSSVHGHLQILVVDNASNLAPDVPASAPLRVLPNPNLGGAGGFARGLIEYREGGWSTHVVFMDDDISLEPESIVRTIALLTYSTSEDLCVHGAMMSEEQPWMQFEAGSEYEFKSVYPLRALGRGIDLRSRSVVVRDHLEPTVHYSAWWFTVFPMHIAKDNPLPVFFRGDDVAFGLMHTGKHTVTLNGIAVWHADFALKNNPSSLYYEVRNFALIDTLVFDDHKWRHLAWRYLGFGFRNAYSHRYASAEFMIWGMKDFLAGPTEWMKIDHAAKHDLVRQTTEEKAGPLTEELKSLGFTAPRAKMIRLGGFLLSPLVGGGKWIPKKFRSNKIGVAQIDVRAVGLAIRHDKILYRHPRFDEGYLCERDYKRFVSIQREVFTTTIKLCRNYNRLKREYRAMYPEMVSDVAWKARFKA
jgi:galactofuranosylgalactofuranosylrhamnosyl-N-acetylglucosaminyl-diphospho-decaprenol beta-1,5/1,6-galactofuranosyltransferase